MLHKESVLPRDKDNDCYCGGVVNWRTAVVHYVAKAVGLMVKIEGMPLGTSRNLDRQSVDERGSTIRSGYGPSPHGAP
jgi:hypothetical protein